jgi:hypothetical protein
MLIETIQNIHSKEDLNQFLGILDESHFRQKQIENLEKIKQVYKTCSLKTYIR